MTTTTGTLATPTRSGSIPAGTTTTMRSESAKVGDSPGAVPEIVPPGPPTEEAVADNISRKRKTSRWSSLPRYPGCAEALRMLTLRPVFATSTPRHHVERRGPDGSRRVLDRATNEQFVVYSPRFVDEFHAGHQAGMWYLRATSDVGASPHSIGFPTAGAAVDGLRAGQWRLNHSRRDRERADKLCRIIWS